MTWLATILLLCAVCAPLHAQVDSLYTVEVVGVGSIQSTRYDEPPTELSTTNVFTGSAFLGRILWRPEYLLAVGLQSGYLTFSEETFRTSGAQGQLDLAARLTGIPVHVAVSVQPGQFDIGVGLGMYILQAIWRADDVARVNSTATEFGVHTWIGYDIAIFDRLQVGPEVSAHVLSNRGIVAFNAGIRVRFDAVRY
jgi:hypothetical protein